VPEGQEAWGEVFLRAADIGERRWDAVIVDEEPETGHLSVSDRILDVVAGGEHWELQAISKILHDIPYDTIKKTVSRLVQRGLLFKDETGRFYEPPKSGVRLRSLPGSRGVDA